jgi:histidine triad (HIT) family protein
VSGGRDPGCLFCAILGRGLEGKFVLEEERVAAFLDNRPLFPGHALLVPRAHFETLTDLPSEMVPVLFTAAQRLAEAMEVALGAKGSFVAINNRVSQSVPHLHVHVVPRRPKDGLRGFFWPRQRYRDERHMEETAEVLRTALGGGPSAT